MIFDIYHDGEFHMMDWWYGMFVPYTWLVNILTIGLFVTTSIVIAYYVHKDAIRRGIGNSEVWLIISLIFNVVGLLVYLLVRGSYDESQSNVKDKID